MLKTPLYEEHIRLGARMAPFAGWDMPIQYSGIIQEHLHTRSKAGLFDICHMGEFILKGKESVKALDSLITCKVHDMAIGRCRYGFLLDDKGKILDDLIAFKIASDEFMLVVNAGTVDFGCNHTQFAIAGRHCVVPEGLPPNKTHLQPHGFAFGGPSLIKQLRGILRSCLSPLMARQNQFTACLLHIFRENDCGKV